jgi:TrmH family RNA methyltransferase
MAGAALKARSGCANDRIVTSAVPLKLISSRDNPLFKSLKKLSTSARERKESNCTLIDGEHLLTAYLDAIGVPQTILVSAAAVAQPTLQALLCRAPGAQLVEMPEPLFRELAPVQAPTGILALVKIPDVAATVADFCMLLEDIQDPGNLGSILRSAAAAGAGVAYLSPQCADAWSPKVLRAGMGAHFLLAIRENADLAGVAAAFPGTVVAAGLHAGKSLYELDLGGAVAFVIGNEGAGVSAQLWQAAHEKVTIPMPGRMESLNAAAAAAVCCFERVRQRGC